MGDKVTVGYWYGLGVHMGICHGPVDEVKGIYMDDRVAWTGSGTPPSSISIDKKELFGGKRREGGLQGTMTILQGGPTQAQSSYLQGQLGTADIPAYRGILSMIWRGLISANNPYMKDFSFDIRRVLSGWNTAVWHSTKAAIGNDMNPAHIAYQVITDQKWGMGYPTSSISNSSFTAAADALHAEGFGLSMQWTRQETIQEFLGIIMSHIGGVIRSNPITGLFELKLLRADYDPETLPVLDESCCTLEEFQRVAAADIVNEVTLVYTDGTTFTDTPITVHNLAAIQSQGTVVNKTIRYPGITSATIASRVAGRELVALSSPLSKVKIIANRKAWNILPGDCFKLTWPKLGISSAVFRAIKVNVGTLLDGKIMIEATEDIYGLPATSFVDQEDVGWVPPGTAPAASPNRMVTEWPYWDLARTFGAANIATLAATDCYLSIAAQRPSSDAFDPAVWSRPSGGTYAEQAPGVHCPMGFLASGLSAAVTSTLTLSSAISLDEVAVGSYCVVGGEYMRVDSVNNSTMTVGVARGALDTVPVDHLAGAAVFFASDFLMSDGVQWATGETVQVKIQTHTTRGLLDIDLAPQDSVVMAGRQVRPYPPGNFKINSVAYPASTSLSAGQISVSWAHRDRLQQTASIIAQNTGNIGPEAGTTYNLRVYSAADNVLIAEAIGLTGTSQTLQLGQTVALLHFEGANASTTFTDDTGITWSRSGNTQISTAQFALGSASALFDGTGDRINTNHRDGFNASGDFTIECRIRTAVNNAVKCIAKKGTSAVTSGWRFYLDATGKVCFDVNGTTVQTVTGTTTLAVNTWYAVAAVKIGNVVTVFVDGVPEASITLTSPVVTNTTTLYVGYDGASSTRDWNGYIDELRISITGRYTGAYTPASTPFSLAADTAPASVRVELESVRDGYLSWQKHAHTVSIV